MIDRIEEELLSWVNCPDELALTPVEWESLSAQSRHRLNLLNHELEGFRELLRWHPASEQPDPGDYEVVTSLGRRALDSYGLRAWWKFSGKPEAPEHVVFWRKLLPLPGESNEPS